MDNFFSNWNDTGGSQGVDSFQPQQPSPVAHNDNLFDAVPTFTIRLYDETVATLKPSMYTAQSFQELGLRKELLDGVYAMGFNKPSEIQGRALPILLKDPPKNFIGQAPSGTGKTAAYVMTMLQRIDSTKNVTQSICVCPTRELARQVADVVRKLGKFTDITVCEVTKHSRNKGRRIIDQVVVGTPGSLIDTMRRGFIETSAINSFVLDEADNMLEQSGLGDQTLRIKNQISKDHHPYQIMLFSATFSDYVKNFADKFVPEANQIFRKREELTVETIQQICIDCDTLKQKYDLLCNLYELMTVSQSIIFCHTKNTADDIGERMKADGHRVMILHSGLTPEERDKTIDGFRRGQFKVLISTNVLSRGIDILQISLVINYDLPINHQGQVDQDVYLHRIGRTGRFGRRGICVNFVHDHAMYQAIKHLENYFKIKMLHIDGNVDLDDFSNILKQIL